MDPLESSRVIKLKVLWSHFKDNFDSTISCYHFLCPCAQCSGTFFTFIPGYPSKLRLAINTSHTTTKSKFSFASNYSLYNVVKLRFTHIKVQSQVAPDRVHFSDPSYVDVNQLPLLVVQPVSRTLQRHASERAQHHPS